MEECVFCKIVNGELPSTKLYEDAKVLSFLDIMPAAPGHAVIIPKKHYATLPDMPRAELAALINAVQKIGAATVVVTKTDGFNVVQSNHKAAGQVIQHVHFHVIPRKSGDGLAVGSWKQEKAEKKELEEYAKLMQRHI